MTVKIILLIVFSIFCRKL